MAAHWEKTLARWTQAGLIDQTTAERIRLHEEAESAERAGLSRQAIIALILGGIALAAGILLFVAAHWEQISPSARFILVLFLVGVFHGAGAFTGSRLSAQAIHAPRDQSMRPPGQCSCRLKIWAARKIAAPRAAVPRP